MTGIWAAVPVKAFEGAKQRLAPAFPPATRRALAEAMVADVLDVLATVRGLAGIVVCTIDPAAVRLAERIGARVKTDGARDGHTGAVAAMARLLAREGRGGMLTLPGDLPRITAAEVEAVLASHRHAPSFTIVPAHDDLGSNAILLSPPDVVPLTFGDNSFFPHLLAARHAGIEPTVVRLPGIGMDIDQPADIARLLAMAPPLRNRTFGLLAETAA